MNNWIPIDQEKPIRRHADATLYEVLRPDSSPKVMSTYYDDPTTPSGFLCSGKVSHWRKLTLPEDLIL